MTRGYKPLVAIGEAQRRATAWGFMLIGLVTEAQLPFDFIIHDRGSTSLVRVRRLKYASVRNREYPPVLCAGDQGTAGPYHPGRDREGTLGTGAGPHLAPVSRAGGPYRSDRNR